MRKFLIIAIFTLILYSISVSAQASFNIIEDSANATGGAGGSASGSFTINNTGTEDLNIEFTSDSLTRIGGVEQLTISSLNDKLLDNGTPPQTVTFSVEIPDAQQAPGLYTGTLTATNGSLFDTITINVNVTTTFSVSTNPSSIMDIGSVTLNTTHIRTFNITNTGNDDIADVTFDFSNSVFNLKTNKTNFVLEFNSTETIQFNITIPATSSTGNLTLGTVKIVSTNLKTLLFDVKANVGGGLIIEDLDVFLTTRIRRSSDGILRSESGSHLDVLDGKRLNFDPENVGPKSELRFNFNIENTFTDDDDIDIDDITIKVTIEEIDDGDDLEEESNEFNLDSDSNEDIDVIIQIPLSVDTGLYDILIEVEGEDDNGNKHTVKMELTMDIDKESRDVIVSKASLFPEKIKCSRTSTLTATIKNIGNRLEDDAKIEIINIDLDINFVRSGIELEEDPFDSDNEYTKKITINVDKNTAAGTYPIEVRSYIQEESLWEVKTVNLVVEDCSKQGVREQEPEEEEEETTDQTETVETGQEIEEEITEGEVIPVLQPTTTTEVPLLKKRGFWIVLIALNIILVAGAVFYVVKVVGKKTI